MGVDNMIIELSFAPLFLFFRFLISLIPSLSVANGSIGEGFYHFVGIGLYFVGTGNFLLIIGSVIFWTTLQLSWAVIEWIYKKIPGVS